MSKLSFVEGKLPDLERIAGLLRISTLANGWANRGPIYRLLARKYGEYFEIPDTMAIVPMANGGVALEAMARLHAAKAGRKLRWVASAYSFQNLGRGYFNDVRFLDCDTRGLLDIELLRRADPRTYDGIILTNPFGLYASALQAYAEIADELGKTLIIDNASGVYADITHTPWQAFSLHHTKPFGVGEGGLALVPESEAEALYGLINYGPETATPDHWMQNGKLSDISAAYLIDRLERASDWAAKGYVQRRRITEIAADCGLRPLAAPESAIPMTSMPFLADQPIPLGAIEKTRHLTCAKYYRPLANLPQVSRVFAHLVNVPCHADVARLSDDQIAEDLLLCTDIRKQAIAS